MEGILDAHNVLIESMEDSKQAYKHKRIILRDINRSAKKIRILNGKIEYQISKIAKHSNMSNSRRSRKETKIHNYKKKIKELKKQEKRLNEESKIASQKYAEAGNAERAASIAFRDLLAGL